jgi:hypothetical protein
MKNLLIFIFLFVSIGLQAQRGKVDGVMYDTIVQVADVTDDTTVFVRFGLFQGRYFEIDIDSLSANTDTIECGTSVDKSFYANLTGFPVVANKAAVAYECFMDGTKKSRIAVSRDNWTAKYVAIRYKKVGSTTGVVVLIY